SGDPKAYAKAKLPRGLELAIDGVDRAAFDVALDAAEVLADERQDETLDAEDGQDRDAAEQRAREVRLADPEDDAVDAQRECEQRRHRAEEHADPLDGLWPVAGQDVEGEPR